MSNMAEGLRQERQASEQWKAGGNGAIPPGPPSIRSRRQLTQVVGHLSRKIILNADGHRGAKFKIFARKPAFIVSTCRSVLDLSTKKMGWVGNTLSKRIDELRANGTLTQSPAGWAHEVRIDDNEAIHEISATHKEAQELVNLIRGLLDPAFVLPRKIQERRQAVV